MKASSLCVAVGIALVTVPVVYLQLQQYQFMQDEGIEVNPRLLSAFCQFSPCSLAERFCCVLLCCSLNYTRTSGSIP